MKYLLFDSFCAVLVPSGSHMTVSKVLFCHFICRASMIWIIGEYAERIDNADELLENFLDGFHDENTQVNYELS